MKIKKKWLIILPIVIALAAFVGLYCYFNNEDQNSFTIAENKWIKNNLNTIIDFDILNDYPVFGENGVFRTFINDFSKDTGFEFNIIAYLKETELTSTGYRFRILNSQEQMTEDDLLLQEDVYVLFGNTKDRISDMNEMSGKTIGILSSDSNEIIYYLNGISDIKYKTYDSSELLFTDYDNKTIEMMIIPNTMYLNKTLEKENYNIKYVFTELSKKVVLTLADNENNEKMNTIVRKYFNSWKARKYVDVYNKNLLDFYISKNNINDKEKTEFLTKTYVYGYVENYPYEVKDKEKLSGIAAEYVNRMMRLSNSDFVTFKKYDNIEELKKAVDKGDVDIYFNYYDYQNGNYNPTISPFIEKYVVLGKLKDKYVVSSLESMKGKKVSIVKDNSVYNYFKDNGKASLVPFESLDKLLDKSSGNLIVVDKEIYSYYKHSKLEDYEVLYESTITNDYNFMIKKEKNNTNSIFYKIFNYIIGTNSYYNYRNTGLNSLNLSILEKSSFEEIYIYILILILVPIIVGIILYTIFTKSTKVKEVKKEERRKYTDMLTSLKNRNYLNRNMKLWDDSTKYPQSVIIIDLNNVKYVNDNYGHEQGDKLIVGAASILINTQLENSEIVRSDGNEFLIYLVGYSEQQIATYTKKLTKEFKTLPYGFGAAIGYSMIVDEIKTVDDAINEATLEMRKDKEEYK